MFTNYIPHDYSIKSAEEYKKIKNISIDTALKPRYYLFNCSGPALLRFIIRDDEEE